MRKLFAVAMMSMALSGCGAMTADQLAKLQALEDQIQQAAVKACGFLPTASSLINLIGGNYAAVPEAIAAQICAALVSTQPAVKFGSPSKAGAPAQAVVNGVTVKGVYVR